MTINNRLIKNQSNAVAAFVEKFGDMTIEEFLNV